MHLDRAVVRPFIVIVLEQTTSDVMNIPSTTYIFAACGEILHPNDM